MVYGYGIMEQLYVQLISIQLRNSIWQGISSCMYWKYHFNGDFLIKFIKLIKLILMASGGFRKENS